MDTVRKGNLILKEVTSPDGGARLIGMLQKIFPKATPEQLQGLLSRPKPFVLSKNISEATARKLVELLQPHGAILEFVPSAGEQVPATQAAPLAPPPVQTPTPPPGPRETAAQPPVQAPPPPQPAPPKAPAPPTIPGSPPQAAPPTPSPSPLLPPVAPPDQNIQAAQPVAKPGPRRLALKFTGSAGEYFRIWIVNIVLTVLTLGIYGAWAKVRTRRYFYANTLLDNQPFDYTARPGTILKGHLIVGAALIIMNISAKLSPLIGSLITAAAWCTVPFLLYKAHRFKAKNSVYRNIRFRFLGDAMGAYKAYAFIPLFVLLGLTLALPTLLSGGDGAQAAAPSVMAVGIGGLAGLLMAAAFPYFMYLQRRYFHGNIAYGKTSAIFKGESGRFYGIYLRAFLMMLAIPFFGGIFIAIFGAAIFRGGGETATAAFFLVGAVAYGMFLLLFTVVQQYIYARTFNYSWGNTKLGPITFDVDLSAKALAWIRFTNVIAIVFSLGFMAPWAKVRRAKYILPQTTAILPADMGAFEAAKDTKEGAVGDTAADFFDWDIGW